MKLGAVAILDALGFKGIWRREKPDSIIAKLTRLRNVVLEDITEAVPVMMGVERIHRQAAFLSDSLVLGVSVEPGGEGLLGPIPPITGGFPDLLRQNHALRDLLLTLAKLLDVAASESPRLAYRGCIACGAFEFEDVFVLGEAIDEAASLASAADGAFVWYAPSAMSVNNSLGQSNPYMPYVDALAPFYPVPLKDGSEFVTRVLNPLSHREPETRHSLMDELLKTFTGGSEDVQLKKRKTEKFLQQFLSALSAQAVFEKVMPKPPKWKR